MGYDDFIQCVSQYVEIDTNIWKAALYPVLTQFIDEWKSWAPQTQLLFSFIALPYGKKLLSVFVSKLLSITEAELVVAFAEAIGLLVAGGTLGTFLNAAMQCA